MLKNIGIVMDWELWLTLLVGIVVTGCFLYSIKKYFAGGVCNCTTRLDGLSVIITGGSSGIGKATAIALAKRGAHIILACRNIKEACDAQEEVINVSGNQCVSVKYLDLASFQSIRHFSHDIHRDFDKLFSIVNNAGVFFHKKELTADGYDITFQTNFLGPFYLTYLLLDLLKKSNQARIVNVASKAHHMPRIRDALQIISNQKRDRCHFKAYGVSKLALVSFTSNLAKELTGTNVYSYAVDPGNCETQMFRNFPLLSIPILFKLQKPLRYFVIKTPEQGSQSVLHALLCPYLSTHSGSYIVDCKISKPSAVTVNYDFVALLDKFSKYKMKEYED